MEKYSKAVSEMYSQFKKKEAHPMERYIGRYTVRSEAPREIAGYVTGPDGVPWEIVGYVTGSDGLLRPIMEALQN